MVDSVQAMASTEKLSPSSILDMAQEWKVMGDTMVNSLVDFFSGIESREQNLRSVSESVEMRLNDLEERERKIEESKLLQEARSAELKLNEEKLDGLLLLVHEHIDSLEASQAEVEGLRVKECEKLKEIEDKKRELDVVGGFLEKRLHEAEMREKEFDAVYRGRLEELALKEKLLSMEKHKLVEEVMSANKGFIMRVETAHDSLGTLKVMLDQRFKEIESRETIARESLTARLNEADLIRESVERRFKELEDIEKELSFPQVDDRIEEKSSEQQNLGFQNKPGELEQGNLECCEEDRVYEEGECREEERRFKELEDIEKELTYPQGDDKIEEKSSEQQNLGFQNKPEELEQGNLECCEKERDYEEGECREDESPSSSKQTHVVNDPEKVLELKEAEIYEILSLSPDPAKLVLDAVRGFHANTECETSRATILLLEQLTKISPKMQYYVTVTATKFAYGWKSKLCTTFADPMEILAFLHLLAAFHLSCRFNKDELFTFLTVVGKHKRTPELCRALGLADRIPGYIETLIKGKKYLLASVYIHEYQLQHTWKQSDILNYYVTNAKRAANAKARNQPNALAAQVKAIASETGDLRIALHHIHKYGLESDYSPEVIRARIQQLGAIRASLRRGNPSSSPNTKKQDWNKNKWRFHKSAMALNSWSPPQKRHRPNDWVNIN